MNIGILCHSSMGGSVRIALELTKELANRGHRVHLFTQTTPFGYVDNQDGVILHPIVPDHKDRQHPAMLHLDWSTADLHAFVSNLLRVVQEEKLDVLHFHYAIPFAFIAAEIKQKMGQSAPLLAGTFHGSDVSVWGQDSNNVSRFIKILPQMDGLTTVSQSHAELVLGTFGLSFQLEIIPNFVDLSVFKPRLIPQKRRCGRGKGKWEVADGKAIKISHVSNFRPVKDLQSVFQIFAGIREHIETELWLIGDGQEMGKVKVLAKQYNMVNQIHYWGICTNVVPILRQTHLLVIASKAESFCMAALEAMACGIPVLATNVGGLSELVLHGKTGFLFPPGNHGSAVNLAVELLSNAGFYENMSQAATDHAQKFSKEKIVSAYEDFYRRLLYKNCPSKW